MNKLIGHVAVCAALVAAAPLALAVRPTDAAAAAGAGTTAVGAGTVDRGGTIQAVDQAGRAIVVEGTRYAVPLGAFPIHWPGNKVSGQWTNLKPGTQIRFSTARDEARHQDQVREIWVTRSPR